MTKAEKENGVEIPEPTAPDVSVREPSIPDEKAPISTEGSEPCALDPRVVRIWRLENLASSGLLFAGTAGGSFALGVFTAFPAVLVPVIWLVFGLWFWISSFWWPPRLYCSWSYRLDQRVIELRYGVLWQKSVMIPLSRVQHVDLLRGPLERHYGLASLEIHTAGTRHASYKLEGLSEETGETLRERLISEADLKAHE